MALRLPRLVNSIPITADGKLPAFSFMQWLSEFAAQIEAGVDAVAAAQAAASAAQTAADDAQAAADSVESVAKLSSSGTTGLTITATDAGSDVTINITAHTRVYGDGSTVSVNSGSLTGLAYSTKLYVYYDDSGFLGGAVTYASTTSEATAAQTGDRHLVGSVMTPAAAAGDTTGGVVAPPGVSDILEP